MNEMNFTNSVDSLDLKKMKEFYDGTPLLSSLKQFHFNDQQASHHRSYQNDIVICGNELVNIPKVSGLTVTFTTEDERQNSSLSNPLSPLHKNFNKAGIKITIDKNYPSLIPLKLTHLFKAQNFSMPFVHLELLSHAKVTLIEEIKTQDENRLFISENYFHLHDNSHLEHIQVLDFKNKSLLHSSYSTKVSRDASYSQICLSLGGKLNRLNSSVSLTEAGAHGEIYSLYLTTENEHSDLFTELNHESADTTSAQMSKGILSGNSKGIFTGKIHIHPKAQRVNSSQLNRNLLLSEKAHANSRPQLEIFADDVKCSHGSTTGQISEEELFYFESRGIPKAKARALLAFGFGQEIILKIKNKVAFEEIKIILKDALLSKFQIGENL